MAVEILLSPGVEILNGPRGARLRGPARAVVETVERLRRLQELGEGEQAQLGTWTLVVSDSVPGGLPPATVSMPGHAWNVAASVLRDVAYGEYDNPLDFGDVGYLEPPPVVDFGVEIVGPQLTL